MHEDITSFSPLQEETVYAGFTEDGTAIGRKSIQKFKHILLDYNYKVRSRIVVV